MFRNGAHWLALSIFVLISTVVGELRAAEPDLPSAVSEIELVGVTEISGWARDQSGRSEPLDEDTTNDMMGGFSAVDYIPAEDVFLFLSDRGPKDGAVAWKCRWQEIRIDISLNRQPPISTELVRTVEMEGPEHRSLTGLATAYESDANQTWRFDPEGIRSDGNGHVYVSDEYGPSVVEFTRQGAWVRRFGVPDYFHVRKPSEDFRIEAAENRTGRRANRGMEGLALSVDNQRLLGLMQSPLMQDCESLPPEQSFMAQGQHCRLIEFALNSSHSGRQFVYRLDHPGHKLNELLATGQDSWLALESDGRPDQDSQFRKLVLINTRNATDVSSRTVLPAFVLPDEIVPVIKTVFIDLLDSRWTLRDNKLPEKIEGLSWGPPLPDGRRSLIIVSDNDFVAAEPTLIYVFAVPESSLQPDAFAVNNATRHAAADLRPR